MFGESGLPSRVFFKAAWEYPLITHRIQALERDPVSLRCYFKNQDLRLLFVLGRNADVVSVELRHQPCGFRAGLGRNGCNDLVIVRALLFDYGDRTISSSRGNIEAVMRGIVSKIVDVVGHGKACNFLARSEE